MNGIKLAEALMVMCAMEESDMSAARKTWAYFDESDQFMFAAEELSKWVPKIGGKVRAEGVDYTIWYIEDGRGVHNVRLERVIDPAAELALVRDDG